MSLGEHYDRCLVHLHTIFPFDSTRRGLDLALLFHVVWVVFLPLMVACFLW